jgi:retron-type reverse transcriptase
MYAKLTTYENIFLAYTNARKHKTLKPYVIEFEKDLELNLLALQLELQLKSYYPRPLETFIIRDPKTRKISKSHFRDRIIHHALCNIIEPIFDKTFIYDSYANRRGKGTLNAIKRYEYFKRKISKNYKRRIYVFKADIKQYFETVNHKILLNIIRKRIRDKNVLWLINLILENHKTETRNKGMPLGNLTSQFFANVYLNELDHYVKETLQVKYYIRYVDDFVILSGSQKQLRCYREKINIFLKESLDVELHPEKTKIIQMHRGVGFLGLRIFNHHRLLKKSNIRKFKNKLSNLCKQYDRKEIDYDEIYDAIEGWVAYSKTANCNNLRDTILKPIESKFGGEISTKEYNRWLKEEKKRQYYQRTKQRK